MSKIIFVIGLSKSGGAEKRAITISNILKDSFDTRVFAFAGDKIDGVDYVFKPTYFEYQKQTIYNRVKALRDYFDKENPDIVISFISHINFFTSIALSKKRYKHIKHIVALAFYKHTFPHSYLLKHSIKRADAVFYQCEDQKKYVKCKCSSFVAPNPITIKDNNIEKPHFRFMSIGRLEPQKDFLLQINAFDLITRQLPTATLDIYGDGSQRKMLLKRIKDLRLEDKVFIHQYTSEIDKEFDKYDSFLFTTTAEGFPNALAEAMAHRLICFTTYFDTGCNDLIIDNETGYLCKYRNAEEYAKLVCEKMSDYENAKRVANQGFEHVKQICDPEIFRKTIVREINKLLGK